MIEGICLRDQLRPAWEQVSPVLGKKSEIFMFCEKFGYTKSTRERNKSEESFINNSSGMGTLIYPLLLVDPIQSPIESIQSTNFLISSSSTRTVEARKRIFVVSVRTLQWLHNFDELMDEASMSFLHHFLITGKICLKSPSKTTERRPNGLSVLSTPS